MQPSIAVIIPVYNASNTLLRAVQSVQAQTVFIETIVLVDDGSTDGSAALCDSIASKDERVVVTHIQNSGPAHARNVGMSLVSSDFIGFVDADDEADTHMYEQLFRAAIATDADIVCCNYYIGYRNAWSLADKYIGKAIVLDKRGIHDVLLQGFYQKGYSGLASLWNKLYRREFLCKFDLSINERFVLGEDSWFNFEALLVANEVVILPDGLYYYHENPTSVTHTYIIGQYDNWKYKLENYLKHNEHLHFEIGSDFYSGFLQDSFGYCTWLCRQQEYGYLSAVLSDSLLHEALKAASVNSLRPNARLFYSLIQRQLELPAILYLKVYSVFLSIKNLHYCD